MASRCAPRPPSPQKVLLCCPACGTERLLLDAEGLPHGLTRMITICPACEGYGGDEPLLIFATTTVRRRDRVRRLQLTEMEHPLENEARG